MHLPRRALGQRTEVTVVDPTPLFPFGHGLSYASATWGPVSAASGAEWDTDGASSSWWSSPTRRTASVSEVVQVYLHDRSASVVRPVQQLVGAVRVDLAPGERSACASLCMPT